MTNRQGFTTVAVLLALTSGYAAADDSPLKGQVIRVTYGRVEDPYLYANDSSPSGYGGVMQDFFDKLRVTIGFIPEITPVSTDSLDALGPNPDANTACARDVFFNRTDLCIGNTWITTERLGYAKVLPTLRQENLKLVVTATQERTFMEELTTAFNPFEARLWIIIFVIILLIAIFTWYVEVEDNDRDFPDKNPFQSFTTSLYHGLYGFFWNEPPTRPVTAEGRILLVGFGFFTLIMLSSYTASLASVMVSRGDQASIRNLETAIVRRRNVCMWETVLERAKRLYPMLVELSRPMDDYLEGYQMMADQECHVMLIDEIFHKKAQSLNPSRECNKVPVGTPVLDINVAWPAADWLIGPLASDITTEVDKGELDALKELYTPKVDCPPLSSSGEEIVGLKVQDVSGVFFIIGFFFVLALLITCFKHSFKEGIRHSQTLQRISERMSRTSKATPKSDSGSTFTTTVRTSGSGRRSSHASDDSDPEQPCLSMVRAFRKEARLRELPFEKALLVMGEAHARQQSELLLTIRSLKGHRLSDTEVPSDDLPTAAPLNQTKVPETSPGARA